MAKYAKNVVTSADMSGTIQYHAQTFRQMSYNQRVDCLQWLGSRAFEPTHRSGPRMLSTVPLGMISCFFDLSYPSNISITI